MATERQRANEVRSEEDEQKDVAEHPRRKRAICLAGGGPAAGLHIGILKGLKEAGIPVFENNTDIWALSCIGA